MENTTDAGTVLLALVVSATGEASWQYLNKMKVGDVLKAAQLLADSVNSQDIGPAQPPITKVEDD